jgi:hypothetical protein
MIITRFSAQCNVLFAYGLTYLSYKCNRCLRQQFSACCCGCLGILWIQIGGYSRRIVLAYFGI